LAAKLSVIGWALAAIGFVLESIVGYVSASCSGVSALGYCYYTPNQTNALGFLVEVASVALLLIGLSMVVVSELKKRKSRDINRAQP
jgi:hypothetical protein